MKRILLSLAAALCMCASAAAQTVAPFKDGDRAVFLGNSITDGGHYHSYIWLYYMTRFPYMDLRVMNAGIGGETAGDMYKRLDGDVFSKRPTVLTVTFGMNDTGYMEYNGDDAGEMCIRDSPTGCTPGAHRPAPTAKAGNTSTRSTRSADSNRRTSAARG